VLDGDSIPYNIIGFIFPLRGSHPQNSKQNPRCQRFDDYLRTVSPRRVQIWRPFNSNGISRVSGAYNQSKAHSNVIQRSTGKSPVQHLSSLTSSVDLFYLAPSGTTLVVSLAVSLADLLTSRLSYRIRCTRGWVFHFLVSTHRNFNQSAFSCTSC
jgi:hypothetical protein